MKKIYYAPNTEVTNIEVQPIMAVSNNGSGEVNSITESDSKYSGGAVLSRESSSIWDEEEY